MTSSDKTLLKIHISLGGHRNFSWKYHFVVFLSTSLQYKVFGPHILPILPTGALHSDKKHSKYVLTSSNQSYIPITYHFGRHRRVFGKLLIDFWSISPKFDYILPQISPIFPTGVSQNDKNPSKYVFNSSKQTYLTITNHLGGHKRVFGKLLIDFFDYQHKIRRFLAPNFAYFAHWSFTKW